MTFAALKRGIPLSVVTKGCIHKEKVREVCYYDAAKDLLEYRETRENMRDKEKGEKQRRELEWHVIMKW